MRGLGNQAKFEAQSLAKTAQRAIATEKELLRGEISSVKNGISKFLNDESGSLTLGKSRYKTTPLKEKYEGEEYGKAKEWIGVPHKVEYLSKAERSQYELFVKDGKLVDTKGNLFDTTTATSVWGGKGNAIFVMDEGGRIFARNYHEPLKFHHSSFLAGKPVASAGEMVVENGRIIKISNRSGHYGPSELLNEQVIKELERRGMGTKHITPDNWK